MRFDANYRAIPHYYLELALTALSETKQNRLVSQHALELKDLFSNSSEEDKNALTVALENDGITGLKKVCCECLVLGINYYFLPVVIFTAPHFALQ